VHFQAVQRPGLVWVIGKAVVGVAMTDSDSADGPKPPRKAARKQDWITNQLRRVYDEALQEDIPADMLALLAKLDDGADNSDKEEDS
jgi:hypothetical protein